MANQQLSRASSAEEYAFVRKILDDAIDRYMPIGGPSLARKHVEVLGDELQKLYPDCTTIYYEVLTRICQAEKEEQQQAEAHKLELQQQMMIKAVMSAIRPQQRSTPPAHVQQECPVLPAKLSTPEAMQLWQLLQQAGLIDEYYQPINLSRTDVALLAYEMTMRLSDENEILTGGIEWKPFETLWNRKNLKADYNRAMKQDKTAKFLETLKNIFAGSTYR